MTGLALKLWMDDTAQDIAEYAVMLAVILVLVVGTIRLVGSNANNAFSTVAAKRLAHRIRGAGPCTVSGMSAGVRFSDDAVRRFHSQLDSGHDDIVWESDDAFQNSGEP
jgi:Flp pilus assembly pilin Flp